ncbi:hypothetical protein RyT2_17320 [Pseudolactococcus yaeyamensis]
MATRKELAKSKNILEVAQQLGIELKKSGSSYQGKWQDHESFVFMPAKNLFYWNGRSISGDTIKLVEIVKDVSYKEALNYVLSLEASTLDLSKLPKPEPYIHRLKEEPLSIYGREFLKRVRGLSDKTIDFFISQKVLAQTEWYGKGYNETVLVFKNYDFEGNVAGVSLQGIFYDKERHEKKGRLKHIMPNSSFYAGITVDIGDRDKFREATIDNPFTIYAFESSLDLMAYYELHQETLHNARLVSMEGRKKSSISAEVVDARVIHREGFDSLGKIVRPENYLNYFDEKEKGLENLKIVLCVDNDEAGRHFIQNLGFNSLKVVPHLPPLAKGMEKNDWNDQLKIVKESRATEMTQERLQEKQSSEVFQSKL